MSSLEAGWHPDPQRAGEQVNKGQKDCSPRNSKLRAEEGWDESLAFVFGSRIGPDALPPAAYQLQL